MTTGEQLIDYEALTQNAMRSVVHAVLERASNSGLPGDHHFYISFDTCGDGVSVSKRLKEKYATEMTIVLQHRFWDLNVFDDYFEVKLTFDGIPERLVIPYKAIKVFFDPSVRYGLQFEEPDFNSDALDRTMTPLEMSELIKSTRDNSDADALAHLDDRPRTSHKHRSRDTDAAKEDGIERVIHTVDDDQDAQPIRPKKSKKPSKTDAAAASAADAGNEDATGDDDEADTATGAEIVSLDAFRKK